MVIDHVTFSPDHLRVSSTRSNTHNADKSLVDHLLNDGPAEHNANFVRYDNGNAST
ncbi:uncharacterized protein M421DRAFT_426498, partial [Didymella exigua CBS 183.55]